MMVETYRCDDLNHEREVFHLLLSNKVHFLEDASERIRITFVIAGVLNIWIFVFYRHFCDVSVSVL